MHAFNDWYYSWAPSISYMAAMNPWFLSALRVGVYPLIGALYASYFAYMIVFPLSSEAGAIAAGMVAASLIGLMYVTPVAYVSLRLIRRRLQFSLGKVHLLPVSGWVAVSTLMVGAAYASGSAWLMALATASLTLSTLTAASAVGAMALTSIHPPLANLHTMVFAVKRVIQPVRQVG